MGARAPFPSSLTDIERHHLIFRDLKQLTRKSVLFTVMGSCYLLIPKFLIYFFSAAHQSKLMKCKYVKYGGDTRLFSLDKHVPLNRVWFSDRGETDVFAGYSQSLLYKLLLISKWSSWAVGVLPSDRLMGMCRWMGSHFHEWIWGYIFIRVTRMGLHFFTIFGVGKFKYIGI